MAKKILIIDDDKDIIESLQLVLESKGYDVESTLTTKGAVELVKSMGPDLIILDVMFPESSSEGFDLARELNRDQEARQIPVLMLSAVNARFNLGFSNKDRDENWLPVAEFMEKPVQPLKLVQRVEELIG
jgi:two-component system, OmpR family, alkaline phosphatase synthesis response regulator PhoP